MKVYFSKAFKMVLLSVVAIIVVFFMGNNDVEAATNYSTGEGSDWRWYYDIDSGSEWFSNMKTGDYLSNGWYMVDYTWYYFDASGYTREGFVDGYRSGMGNYPGYYSWYQDENGWYYMNESGLYLSSDYAYIDGVLYLFDDSGYLAKPNTWIGVKYGGDDNLTSWFYSGDTEGGLVNGWRQIDGKWYYFWLKGKIIGMICDEWIDGYYLADSGEMDTTRTAQWYNDGVGWYYMDSNGKYITKGEGQKNQGILFIDGNCETFDNRGYWIGK